MENSLLSVGLDVGTTTTQLIVSRLEIQNRAGAFAVPEMEITSREILYRSPVHFTPLSGGTLVDGEALKKLVEEEYQKAGISKEAVDTGAVIITGETSRKENAAAVLAALSGFAGDFVAATAGPHLESVLAAQGSGAVAFSEKTVKPVLHMDIGGGTANLVLIEKGKLLKTGCLNVGGRLIRHREGRITYVSPVLKGLTDLKPGDTVPEDKLRAVAQLLTQALEMAAGLVLPGTLLEKLSTKEAGAVWEPPQTRCVLSFSGGVADCIGGTEGDFGDIGHLLGRCIRESSLCRGQYRLGTETIRATVIGAGCHSARLSGSTVFCEDVELPVKNLPVVVVEKTENLQAQLSRQDGQRAMVAISGKVKTYGELTALAQTLGKAATGEFLLCLESDMAKALGQKLRLMYPHRPCLCIDRIKLTEGTYLDIGKPVGSAFPVIVKTLVLGK